MKLTSAQVERTLGQFRSRGHSRRPSSGSTAERSVRGTHFLPRQQRARYRGAGRGCSGGSSVGQGRESCQLEQRQSDRPGASRPRTDRRRHHAWVDTLIQVSGSTIRTWRADGTSWRAPPEDLRPCRMTHWPTRIPSRCEPQSIHKDGPTYRGAAAAIPSRVHIAILLFRTPARCDLTTGVRLISPNLAARITSRASFP
jgi:hypothetical protein